MMTKNYIYFFIAILAVSLLIPLAQGVNDSYFSKEQEKNTEVKANAKTQPANVDKKAQPQSTEQKAMPKVDINSEKLPDFKSITNVKEKKEIFFAYMYPLVVKANKEVLQLKQKLHNLIQSKQITNEQTDWVMSLCDKYNAPCDEKKPLISAQKLHDQIGIIPPSLTLAQAANESAWGTSCFAKKANNFFGQWCFRKGCGIVPKQRNSGSVHEVRKFNTPYESVKTYIFNLNSNNAYKSLRSKRAKLRSQGKHFTGKDLTTTLKHYSERGADYIKELNSMIRINKFSAYDERLIKEIN
jgi:Bax protein